MARHKSLIEYNRNLPDGDPMKKEIPDQPPEFARLKPRMSWFVHEIIISCSIYSLLLYKLGSGETLACEDGIAKFSIWSFNEFSHSSLQKFPGS